MSLATLSSLPDLTYTLTTCRPRPRPDVGVPYILYRYVTERFCQELIAINGFLSGIAAMHRDMSQRHASGPM